MRRQISSRFTFLYRWVIPGLLTVAALLAIWLLAVSRTSGPPAFIDALGGFAIAVALFSIARIFDRAKWVWLDDNQLLVSDTNQEIAAPLGEIDRVTVTPLFRPYRVRIWFRNPTVFGPSVAFFPPLSITVPKIVEELRQLAGSGAHAPDPHA